MKEQHFVWLGVALVGVVMVGLLLWAQLGRVDAQGGAKKEQVVETRAQVGDKQKYPTTEVKNTREGTPEGELIGKRQGPDSCDVVFVNRTPWWIHRTFVDKRYVGGVMAPWGEYILRDVTRGSTELYLEADFERGPLRFWGPHVFSCPPWTRYTFTLYP